MTPFKCPECGVWWTGVEHRCRYVPPQTSTNLPPITYTLVCNCIYDDHGRRLQTTPVCPVHDVRVTYT